MRVRAVAVLTLVLAGASIAPGAATADAADRTPAPLARGGAETLATPEARYARDVVASARALLDLSRIMRDADDLEAFRADYARATRALGRFRRAVERMDTYRLASPRADRRRAALARTGPPLARALTRFLAAARRGDAARVRRLLPVVRRSVARFQEADRPVR
jgi:hypothetical protein